MSKTVMTKKERSTQETATQEGLVPRLRFPEFVGSGDWVEKRLGGKVTLLSGYPFKGFEITEDSSGIPLMRGINITEGTIRHNQIIDRFFLGDIKDYLKYQLEPYDLVIGMDGSKVGKNSALVTDFDAGALLVQRVARLRASSKFVILFIFQYINSINFHSYVDRINTSSGIPHISAQQINDFRIPFPLNEKEQQRIADCLSSLDTIITAQEQKIKKLEDHKKGLMQKLFPKQGERVPALRFKDFVDSGNWEEKKLGQIAVFCGGGTPSRDKEEFWQGAIPWISSSDIYKDNITCLNISRYITDEAVNASATKICPTGSILLVTRVGVGKLAIAPAQLCTSQDFTSITQTTENNIFLAYFLLGKMNKEANSSQGTSIKGITTKELKKIIIFIPSLLEQQRIADCLTSLDELIVAHRKKLNFLKEHKKGLMQGLFPVAKA